jgi:hypothetical protein
MSVFIRNLGADTGALRSEQALFRTNRLDQQPECAFGVEHSIIIEFAHPFRETLGRTGVDRSGFEPAKLVRHRPTAVADNDLQVGKVIQHVGVDEVKNRRRFFVDEVKRIGLAIRP